MASGGRSRWSRPLDTIRPGWHDAHCFINPCRTTFSEPNPESCAQKLLLLLLVAACFQGAHNGAVNEGKLQLLEFLRGLSYKGRHLLINPNRLLTLQQLQGAVLRGDRFLDEVDEEVRKWGCVCWCVVLCVGVVA